MNPMMIVKSGCIKVLRSKLMSGVNRFESRLTHVWSMTAFLEKRFRQDIVNPGKVLNVRCGRAMVSHLYAMR